MMYLELSGQTVLLTIGSLGLLIAFGVIVYGFVQARWKQDENQRLTQSLIERTKYRNKNFLIHRPKAFGIGLAISLAFAITALSWTVYEYEVDISEGFLLIEDDLEVVPPPTDPKPPPPPPPPPPPIEIEEVKEEPLEENKLDIIDPTIDIEEPVVAPPPTEPGPVNVPLPPPPMPEAKPEIEEVLNFAQHMPLFGDCEDKACSDKALMTYIYKNIKYPPLAAQNGIEGRVTASFVVEKDGTISDVKILRGIGAGCDKEVISMIESMNDLGISWKAGKHRGFPVRVLYKLPVTFELEN